MQEAYKEIGYTSDTIISVNKYKSCLLYTSMLSNGPGDPKACVQVIKEIRKLYETEIPIFAICLGHQLMALATGADTFKLKYGHRGGNHPVKNLSNR